MPRWFSPAAISRSDDAPEARTCWLVRANKALSNRGCGFSMRDNPQWRPDCLLVVTAAVGSPVIAPPIRSPIHPAVDPPPVTIPPLGPVGLHLLQIDFRFTGSRCRLGRRLMEERCRRCGRGGWNGDHGGC